MLPLIKTDCKKEIVSSDKRQKNQTFNKGQHKIVRREQKVT